MGKTRDSLRREGAKNSLMEYSEPIVPTQLNPDVSFEMEREVAFFLKWGYLIVDDALHLEQVETLRAAFDETAFRRHATNYHTGCIKMQITARRRVTLRASLGPGILRFADFPS